ncbi:Lectin [Rhynchospora pubera]|uniref:non-specific serine/threonine protein kinase n=1 Tax=Rhynchospora pubera TaxID=906938 RepID=A0AAV8EMZ8_9POAL|nr:Lectin [Rhynchospora pubera]
MSFAFLLTTLLILPAALGVLDGAPIDSVYRGNMLLSGETLETNQYLQKDNCVLKMQEDCNLVMYDSGSATWASQTANQGSNCKLLMQYDGNLVLYDSNGNPLWHSNTGTANSPNIYPCILQSNCHIVIYGPYQWSNP